MNYQSPGYHLPGKQCQGCFTRETGTGVLHTRHGKPDTGRLGAAHEKETAGTTPPSENGTSINMITNWNQRNGPESFIILSWYIIVPYSYSENIRKPTTRGTIIGVSETNLANQVDQ